MKKTYLSQCVSAVTAAMASTILMSSGAYAQDDALSADEEVVVTGFRRSVQNALNLKKEETSIVEAISAEDIGKLPDSSIAESLARLPGLAGERRGGRTSGLSVRGFNENFVGTTMNGRELLGIGDNRGVEYDLYPSEIISSAVVYKSSEARLITQGVGGTVDLRTTRPLELDDRVIAINGNYEQNGLESLNPDYDDTGHRLSFTYADKYADDTIGLAITVATLESPSQEELFQAWGYNNTDGTTDGKNGISGTDSFSRSAVLERDTYSAVLQFEPTDRLNITIDGLYIDYEEADIKRGFEQPLGVVNVQRDSDGFVTSGEIGTDGSGFHSVIRNDGQTKEGELTTFGLNVEFDLNDSWSLEFDGSWGETEKDLFDIESYSGVGRPRVVNNPDFGIDPDASEFLTLSGNGRTPFISGFEMTSTGIAFSPLAGSPDYANPDMIVLAGPQAWGGSLTPVDAFAPRGASAGDFALNGPSTAQDGFINNSKFEEELTALRLNLKGELELGFVKGVEVGLNYSDREKTKDNDGAFLTAPSWPAEGPIPEEFRLGALALDHLGGIEIFAYDSIGLYNSGYYTETDSGQLETSRLGDSYTVEEELLNLFVQFDLEAELGDMVLSGNVGVQVAQADQQATGFNTTIGEDLFVLAEPVSGGTDYTKVLPSLNLNLEVTEDVFVRTALSKSISRPRIDDMRPNNQVTFAFNDFNVMATDIANSPWSGSAGNPELEPLEANNFDLSAEWYFSDEGALSATFFYKDLVNWTISGSTITDFTEFFIPGYHAASDGSDPVLFTGTVSNRQDGLEGFVRGTEYTATLPANMISEALDGLGLIVSATFTEGEFDDGSAIPGLSEEIIQVTAFYQKAGFDFRLSGRKRDQYLSERRGGSLSLTNTTDVGSELWDAQIGYDFAESGIAGLEGLTLTLQAQNLTDEETVQTDPNGNITQYQSFGANYLLGVNYKF